LILTQSRKDAKMKNEDGNSREKAQKAQKKDREGKTIQPQMNPPPLRFLLRPLFPELWRTRWRDRLRIYADIGWKGAP
jgi:hypothetical protein